MVVLISLRSPFQISIIFSSNHLERRAARQKSWGCLSEQARISVQQNVLLAFTSFALLIAGWQASRKNLIASMFPLYLTSCLNILFLEISLSSNYRYKFLLLLLKLLPPRRNFLKSPPPSQCHQLFLSLELNLLLVMYFRMLSMIRLGV